MTRKLVVGIDVLYSVNYDVIKINLGSQGADGQFPDTVIALGKVGALTVVTHEHGAGQLHGLSLGSPYAEGYGMVIVNLG